MDVTVGWENVKGCSRGLKGVERRWKSCKEWGGVERL